MMPLLLPLLPAEFQSNINRHYTLDYMMPLSLPYIVEAVLFCCHRSTTNANPLLLKTISPNLEDFWAFLLADRERNVMSQYI